MAAWFKRLYNLPALDPASQVLPVNGSREALFAFAQAVIDRSPGNFPRRSLGEGGCPFADEACPASGHPDS